MHGNNFLHFNKGTVLFANVTTEDIDLRGNYWDVESEAEIDAVILDKNDTPALGEIVYDNRLLECDTTIPIAPPFMVKKQLVNNRWLVSWDENLENDVDHYALFYGDFNYYKFANLIDGITGNSYVLASQQVDNVAVVACDRAYNPDVYAAPGQSAFAFAAYYPYAGADADLCDPQTNITINDANIPYTYNGFVWHTSGSGVFSDTLSLQPDYYPSAADFEAGEVTLTLIVTSNGTVRSDDMVLRLYKAMGVFAGPDSYSGINRPLVVDQAEVFNYDSLRWVTLGDGVFEDQTALQTLYYPGAYDKEQGYVELVLEAWSFCGYACDTVRYDLLMEYALEGRTWANGESCPNIQVIAAALGDDYPFVSGFYRTVSDDTGAFRFEALLPDTYILYALPDTLQAVAAGCYYLGDLQWNESNMIVVDGDVYDVDIALPQLMSGFNTGFGSIGGVFDYPETPFKARDFYCQPWLREGEDLDYCADGLSNVGILLLNASKQCILGFALTRPDGHFSFVNLPFGTYHVMADLPRFGRGMCEEITLSPELPSVAGLHLFVNQEGKVCMRAQNNTLSVAELTVYPNPTKEMAVVNGLNANTVYSVTVLNSVGMIVLPETQMSSNVLGEVPVSVGALSEGLYFIQLKGASGTMMAKFVKQ
jgi:hypothetical protein